MILWSDPEKTFKFLYRFDPNLFLGNIPLTAFSTSFIGFFLNNSSADKDLCPPGYPVCLIYFLFFHLSPLSLTLDALITITLSPQST